jgi:hypothetical protein
VFVPYTASGYVINNVVVVNDMNIEGELVGLSGPTLIVTTASASAFKWTGGTNASYIRIANFYVKATTTGALFYNQTNTAVYTAYGRFENINTDASLLTSYSLFAIECIWTNCHDGDPNFGAIGAQGHAAIINNPAAFGQGNTSNVNTLRNCRFFGAAPGTAAFVAAIDIGWGFDWYFDTCTFQQMTMQSIRTRGTPSVNFKNCWWEQIAATQMGSFLSDPGVKQGSSPVSWEGGKQDCGQTTTQVWVFGTASTGSFKNVQWTQVATATVLANNPFFVSGNENPYVGGTPTNFSNGAPSLVYSGGTSALTSFTRSLAICSGVATPAGGSAGIGLSIGNGTNFGIFWGSGVPTLSAAQGSLYFRTDGSSTSTRCYVNTNGTTGWTNFTTAA